MAEKKMDFLSLLRRRRTTLAAWCESVGVTCYEELCEHLARMDAAPISRAGYEAAGGRSTPTKKKASRKAPKKKAKRPAVPTEELDTTVVALGGDKTEQEPEPTTRRIPRRRKKVKEPDGTD